MTKQTRRRFSAEYKEQSVARLSDAGTGQEGYDHRSGPSLPTSLRHRPPLELL